MSDIRSLVQAALDTALDSAVKVYWQRKSGKDADEYIVYTQDGDLTEVFADNDPLVKAGDITVRYYYRPEKLDTQAGRDAVISREEAIEAALKDSGFDIPNGKYDAGDIDDVGFYTTVFDCEYWRVI